MAKGTFRHSFKAMNTVWEYQLCGTDPIFLRSVAEEMESEVRRVERMLTLFEPTSETAELNRCSGGSPVVLDRRFYALVERCIAYSTQCFGAFDITVSPLMQAWSMQGGKGALPTEEAISEALSKTGSRYITLAREDHAVGLTLPGMAVDFGAVGKGHAIDCSVEIAIELGLEGALLHCGTSTVYGLGCNLDGEPWKVQVRIPDNAGNNSSAVFHLCNCALSVSAPHGKYFEADNKQYGHVIDPRTGWPTDGAAIAAVSVNAAEASDALSTALLTAGSELLAGMQAAYPELKAVVAWYEGDATCVETVGITI